VAATESINIEAWREYAIKTALLYCRKCKHRQQVAEEAEGLADLALVKAAREYQPIHNGKPIKWQTYLQHCIYGEVAHFNRDGAATIRIPAWRQEADENGKVARRIRRQLLSPMPESISLDAQLSHNNGNGNSDRDARLLDGDSDFADSATDNLARRELLQKWIAHLPEKQREVLRLSFFGGLAMIEIEDRLSMGRGYGYMVKRTALQRLRRLAALEPAENIAAVLGK
jgi:RNA polymerase sigma factor (sigma-70 family)